MLIIEIALGIVLGLWLSRNWMTLPAKLWAALKYIPRLIFCGLRVLFVFTPLGAGLFALRYSRSSCPKAYLRFYFVP